MVKNCQAKPGSYDLYYPINLHTGRPGNIFNQFEDVAIPTISKYNGKLLLRVRPGENAMVEASVEKPYEIHLVEFAKGKTLTILCKTKSEKSFYI